MRGQSPCKTLFANSLIQTVHFPHRNILRWVQTDDVYGVGIVYNTVQNRIGKGAVVTAQLLIPAFLCELGAENGGRLSPPPLEQLKDISLFRFICLEQQPFVNNKQCWIGILTQRFEVGSILPGHIQINQHIRQADIFGFVVMLARFHAESTGHISFSAAGCPGDEDDPVFRDLIALS